MTQNPEQFRAQLDAAYLRNDDPTALVFDNYLRWKGSPAFLVRPMYPDGAPPDDPLVSPHFSVLAYESNPLYTTLCTMGASYNAIPFSKASFGDERGVRYEYILHTPPDTAQESAALLALIAEHPFAHQVEIGPGYILPIGEPVVTGSPMEFLYFTYPYLDDGRLYEENPWGQIERANLLIQTLWVFPIYLAEAEFIRTSGVDAFEERLQEHHSQVYDAYDFMRLPVAL